MVSGIRSHSCLVTLSQTSTQLTNQFINVSNPKFGSTWTCIREIELHMASITEDVIVSLEYNFIAGVICYTINACKGIELNM